MINVDIASPITIMSQNSQTISYRLQNYDYQQALKQARKKRCKSVHEYSRLILLSALEEAGTEPNNIQMLEQLSQLRAESNQLQQEVSQLRLTLAKTLQIILNLNGYDAAQAESFVRENILES